jgi:hypothetical protein
MGIRIPVGVEANIRLFIDDEDGTLVDATGTPTVTIIDGTGTTVVSSVASTRESAGQYKYTLAPRTQLDLLSVTWSAVVNGVTRTYSDTIAVTGSRLVPLWRFREDSELATVSGARLRRISDAVENVFSSALGFPPVTEGLRTSWVVDRYTPELVIPCVERPQSLYSLSFIRGSVDAPFQYSAPDLAAVTSRDGAFFKTDGTSWNPGIYTAWLIHGMTRPPERLIEVGIILGRYIARQNNYPERALRVVSDNTEITFTMTGDADHPTGLPEVDTVLTSLRDPFVI